MKPFASLCAFLCAFCVGIFADTATGGVSATSGVLCLTFDDSRFDDWTAALPIFARHGAHATFFAFQEIDARSVAALRSFSEAGHSIGLHGFQHQAVPDAIARLGEVGFIAEEIEPQLSATREAGLPVRSFAYPMSQHTPQSDALLLRYFDRLRGGGDFEGAFPVSECTTRRYLPGLGLGAGCGAEVVAMLPEIAASNTVLVVYSHGIGETGDSHSISRDDLETILSSAEALGIAVLGFDELGEVARNQDMAAKMPKLDSTAFDFKYEMEALPTEEDLDNDGNPDFTKWLNGSSAVWSDVGCALFDTRTAGGGYIQSENSTSGAWARYGATVATGFTVEARIALREHREGQYAFNLAASVPDSDTRALLNLSMENGELRAWWGNMALTNMAHTGEFHTWRIARAANASTYSVWCDGALVGDNLAGANPSDWGLLLGSASRAYKMSAYVSYLRFTKGGFAPTIEERDSELFEHKYEMDVGDTRFSATQTTVDWTLSGGNTSASLSNGRLSASVSQGSTYFWQSGPMDSSVSVASPFTLEMRLRVHDSWEANGRVLAIYGGTPREYCYLVVGTNNVSWTDKDGHEYLLCEADNSNAMHVFRLAFTGDGDTAASGFMLWRDRELIPGIIKPFRMSADGNNALFGVGSSAYGGSFEVDYVRWTTDGVFAPVMPPTATTLCIM